MSVIGKYLRILVVVFLTISMVSCDELFDYSPYEVRVPHSDRNWNSKQLELLKNDTVFKPFRIALIADTHTEYDFFLDFVKLINEMDNIDFIINNGDVTLSGLSKEFKWYHDIVSRIKYPVVTVVGNHDYLSNGSEVYKTMFGETNFCFIYNNCKFVIFDDIVWENPKGEINYVWLDSVLHNDKNYTHVVPFSHIPPWDEQIDYANMRLMHYMYSSHGIDKSFHGHVHKFMVRHLFDDDTEYVCAPNMKRRAFLMLNFYQDSISYEHVEF